MITRWSQDVAVVAAGVDARPEPATGVAEGATGMAEVDVTASTAGGGPAGCREAVLGHQEVEGGDPLLAVEVDHQEIGDFAGQQADVGELPATPPGGHHRGIGAGVFEAVPGPGMLPGGRTGAPAGATPRLADRVKRDHGVTGVSELGGGGGDVSHAVPPGRSSGRRLHRWLR